MSLVPSARGADAVEVAVNLYLEQHGGGVVGGCAELAGLGLEAELCEVEAVNERVNDPDHVVLGDQLFERCGEKPVLGARLACFARHGDCRGC